MDNIISSGSSDCNNSNSIDCQNYYHSPREVIFHSAKFLKNKSIITVQGTVVLLDIERRRMDLANDGAKLIVRLLSSAAAAVTINDIELPTQQQSHPTFSLIPPTCSLGSTVEVTGKLCKEQRRIFLEETI